MKFLINTPLTLIILYSLQGYAQTYSYKHYGVEDGLPSSETYSAFQDSKGYMWFATDAGVSRFNGYEFENFDVSDGLTDNTVFLITEDDKERVWFGTFNCQLSYYDYKKDSIYPYKFNHVLKDSLTRKQNLGSFNIDSDENVWLGFYRKGLKKISSNGIFYSLMEKSYTEEKIKIIRNNDKINYGTLRGKPNGSILEFILNDSIKKEKIKYKYKKGNIRQRSLPSLVETDKTIYFQQKYSEIFSYKKKERTLTSLTISNELNIEKKHSLYYDQFLYICTEGHGVLQCNIKSDSLVVNNQLLKEESVSRMYKDKEGGYWFMTLENGIFYCSSFLVSNNIGLINEANSIKKIRVDEEDNLFFSSSKGKLFKQSLLTDSVERIVIPKTYSGVDDLFYDEKLKQMLISIGGGLFSYKDKRIQQLIINRRSAGRVILSDSNRVYYGNYEGFYVFENDKEIYPRMLNVKDAFFYTSLIKHDGKIWIGTNDGIRIYRDKKVTNPFVNNKYLSSTITSMDKLNKELLLIGTKNYGLLVMKDDSIIYTINNEKGLIANLVRKVHVDKQGVIWVGTNKGLCKINYNNGTFNILNLTRKKGLPSEEIIEICSYKNTIYITTKTKGLIQFNKTKLKRNTSPIPVFINQFNVNSKKRKIKEKVELTYDENSIKIDFVGLNYRSLGEIEYAYRMLGVDTNWVSTSSREVQYPTLQPNDYVFEVKAKNEDGYWSEPTRLSFSISPPFWFAWWFISLEFLFGIGILSSIFWYREKQNKTKLASEKRMIELELKALRSQMNPHFIFNTLNSIQNYIVLNDLKSSNEYIVQFATLIRTILHVSEKNVISIQEELEILTMYMDLEKMRFEEQFDYQIEVSDEVDVDYDKIPSMLLQPYVENAIWHGLMNKKGKGVIKVEITADNEYLCCSVEDNGIGRKAAAAIKAKRKIEQKSVGMSITKERLDLISNNEVNVETIDLYDSEGEPAGTKMLIRIKYKS